MNYVEARPEHCGRPMIWQPADLSWYCPKCGTRKAGT